jgi:hypothetical protein
MTAALCELFFGELGKRVQEVPGWLPLYGSFLLILSTDALKTVAENRDLDVTEASTIAALLALALVALGDVLDTVLFPRDQTNDKRDEKIAANVLLALSALAVFWWFVGRRPRTAVDPLRLLAGVSFLCLAVGLWVLLILCLEQLRRVSPGSTRAGSGWPWLESERLKDAKAAVRCELQIYRGIYSVSMGLARRAKQYRWGNSLWRHNEIAKLFRSLVFPFAILLSIQVRGRPIGALLAGAGVLISFYFYWFLKVRHMCGLYRTAGKLANCATDYQPPPSRMANGRIAFFWQREFAAAELSNGAE